MNIPEVNKIYKIKPSHILTVSFEKEKFFEERPQISMVFSNRLSPGTIFFILEENTPIKGDDDHIYKRYLILVENRIQSFFWNIKCDMNFELEQIQ